MVGDRMVEKVMHVKKGDPVGARVPVGSQSRRMSVDVW